MGSCSPSWQALRIKRNRVREGFFRFVLPTLALVNLALGLLLLGMLRPANWLEWLLALSGAFCCLVAGWLGGSGLSSVYWAGAMSRQVLAWRRMADAILLWLEEVRIPPDRLEHLRSRLRDLG